MSRSKQITYENVRLRDPAFLETVTRWFANTVLPPGFEVQVRNPPPPMFTPFTLRGMRLENRVVVSPMDQYMAVDGMPNDWHLVHLGSRAVGGAGLVFVEMTCPSPEARISPGCTGLWNEAQAHAFKRIVDFCHAQSGAKLCMQLGHSGRKGSTQLGWERMDHPLEFGNWDLVAPSGALKEAGVDLIDVSTGQVVPQQKPIYGRMYQTPFADKIRNELGLATMAVGNITSADQVNTIVVSGRADLVALARAHLADPYFTLHAAAWYQHSSQFWPRPYLQGRDQAYRLAVRDREEWTAGRQATKPPSHEVKEEKAKDERAAKSGGGPGKKAA